MINFEDGAATGEIEAVTKLIALLNAAEYELTLVDERSKILNDRIKRIKEDALPSVMAELGIQEFKLTDGTVIKIKNDWQAYISEANKPAAHAWLVQNNYGSIIKTAVELEFGSGDEERARAEEAVESLIEGGYNPDIKEAVHAQTLKAFVRECVEKQVAIPLNLFGAFPVSVAQIKQPKTASAKRK